MHKEVTESTNLRHKNSTASHNKSSNIVVHSFSIGDLLCFRRVKDRGPKLSFLWYNHAKLQLSTALWYILYRHYIITKGTCPLRNINQAPRLDERERFV